MIPDEDPLDAARGCVAAVLVGLILIVAVILALMLWHMIR